jgi:AraC-like DNA-binding protein
MAVPGARVSALDLGVSERQLRRRFEDAVGYGPKTLARVLRFQRFLALAAGGGDLARLALSAGYADQAHLTRECRRLAGRTPVALLASGAPAAGERLHVAG